MPSSSFPAQVLVACLLTLCPPVFGQTNVLTQHNDIGRTGQNLTETVLNTTNVNSATFGQLYNLKVDGAVYAQPLYLSSLSIGGVNHSVVFIATEHDSVYAFDAASGAQLWKASLFDALYGAASGATSDPLSDTGCTDISISGAPGEYGISGTPVIDASAGILYVVSRTFENNYPAMRIHALDVTTGLEKLGPPTTIAATDSGTGVGSSGGVVTLDPKYVNNRVGLLLLNGNVYVGFGSLCDISPWHGWILSYSATTLAQTGAFITSPNGTASGVWLGGAGLAADVENGTPRMFPVTGNGTFDAPSTLGTDNVDYGDDVLRLNLTNGMSVADMFTPSNQATLQQQDLDLGSSTPLILPDQPGANPHLMAHLGKQGVLYLLNRDNLGGYNTTGDKVVQKMEFTNGGNYGGTQASGLWGAMAYWNSNLYLWPRNSSLMRYPISNGLLPAAPSETAPQIQNSSFAQVEGVTPSVSANGTQTATGIIWTVDGTYSPQVMYAHNASKVSQLLWSSTQNSARDGFSSNLKQVVPTTADGKVFVGQVDQVNVYGLLSTVLKSDFSLSAASTSIDVPVGSTFTTTISVASLNGFTGTLTLSTSALPTGVTASLSTTNSSVVTLNLTAAASAPLTSSPTSFTVTAASGAISHSVTYSLTINKVTPISSYAISFAPPSLTLRPNGVASAAVTLTSESGAPATPQFMTFFSFTGLPAGVSAQVSASTSANVYYINLTASGAMPAGTSTIKVAASGGGATTNFTMPLSTTAVLLPVDSATRTLASISQPGWVIRHSYFLAYLNAINPTGAIGDRNDSSFYTRVGNGNSSCYSFESLNFPGYFLRHQNFQLHLAQKDGSAIFNSDSTFCAQPGLSGAGFSLQSLNFPSMYMHVRTNGQVWIDASDGTAAFASAASFVQSQQYLPVDSSLHSLASLSEFGALVRHQNYEGYVAPINASSDALSIADASFQILAGNASSSCYSFEASNFPGYFLRHQNFILYLQKNDGSQLFAADSTFCLAAGLSPSGFSLVSYDYPTYYLREQNHALYLTTNDSTALFPSEATFSLVPAP